MKIRFKQLIFLGVLLIAAGCHVEPPREYGETFEHGERSSPGTTTSPSLKQDGGRVQKKDDFSEPDSARRDAGSTQFGTLPDTGSAQDGERLPAGDAGSDARAAQDAQGASSPDASIPDIARTDAGTPDATPAVSSSIFATPELGVLVRASEDTMVEEMTKPAWAEQAVAAAAFTRSSGERYTLLVYEKGETESFESWLSRSEVGDAYVSERRIETANDNFAFVYATNDFGAIPDVHITIPTSRFVYYFHADSDTFDVPEDFINFIEETEVQ